MRVVAGTAGGIRLTAPDGTATRPTSDRVREAVFNVLFSLGGVDGWEVADLFAGTGAMGIEALSRGAASCLFVETSGDAVEVIRTNLAIAGVADRAEVHCRDATSFEVRADLVIVDPPYDFQGWKDLIAGLDARLVVLESDRPIDPGPRFEIVREKTYGGTVVTFGRRADDPSGDPA